MSEPWKRREVDKLLDLYFDQATASLIASELGRDQRSVLNKIEDYVTNRGDRVTRYSAKRRQSRKSKRLTFNEKNFIENCRRNKLSWESIARVLCRSVEEIDPDACKQDWNMGEMRQVAVGVDLVLAYRYLYYCHGVSVVSDKQYDDLETEEIEYGNGGKILKKIVGSDRKDDYPPHIRALGMYLAFKYSKHE